MLIGEDIETCIVFKNAFSKIEKPCFVNSYHSLHKAISAKPNSEYTPDIIFLDTNNSADNCVKEVRQIRDSKYFKDCSLVVYDSNSHLHDTKALFFEGADAFINQPYYFPRLRKVVENITNMDWSFDRLNVNRTTYFL